MRTTSVQVNMAVNDKYGRGLLIQSSLGFLYAAPSVQFYGIKMNIVRSLFLSAKSRRGDKPVPSWDI